MPIGQENAASPCNWESFFDRALLVLDRTKVQHCLAGKRVLITGAGGSIGSALTQAVADFMPEKLVLLEAAERNLYDMEAALRHRSPLIRHHPILGSVSDPLLLAEIFRRYRPQVVYHAAAFKHVPLMEQNAFAAIENNVLGARLLVRIAAEHETGQLIMLSTDKAVDPASIMGVSKRLAELILLSRPRAGQATGMRMKAVRLGNVIGSGGSIVPLFCKQISSGGPVTVTHPDARRYFLSSEDAVTLLLTAAASEAAQGILVPDLGEPVLVQAVAKHLITNAQRDSLQKAAMVFTQLRPGDKMCEALLSARESYVGEANTLRSINSPALPAAILDDILDRLQQACRKRSLTELVAAVLLAVPEYQPSTVIQAGLATESGAGH